MREHNTTAESWRRRVLVTAFTNMCWSETYTDLRAIRDSLDLAVVKNYAAISKEYLSKLIGLLVKQKEKGKRETARKALLEELHGYELGTDSTIPDRRPDVRLRGRVRHAVRGDETEAAGYPKLFSPSESGTDTPACEPDAVLCRIYEALERPMVLPIPAKRGQR